MRLLAALGFERLETWILSGPERCSGQSLLLAFSGTPALKEYHAHLAFSEPPREIALGAVPIRRLAATIAATSPECALSLVELSESNAGLARWVRSTLMIPVWMQIEIELKDSLEASLRRSRFKTIEKTVRNNGLSSEVRTDDATFDEFFHQMYLPHIQARHGAARVVADYDGLKSRFHQGELIMIRHDGRFVGASLIDFGHKEPRMLEMGIRDGDDRYLRLGVSEAVYWFSLARILEKGGGRVRLGNSRPYLRDGALQYKMSMGARLAETHYRKSGFLHVRVLRRTAGLEGYLAGSPFIMEQNARYVVCGFVDKPGDRAAALAEEMLRYQGPTTAHRLYVMADLSAEETDQIRTAAEGCEVVPAERLLGRQA